MSPAIAVALFTKSSAGTLPVTLASAEKNLKADPAVSRFVLPICTTINMNGCAAFILITSLFVMQNAGIELSMTTMLTWLIVAVLAAVGNAGVPMGCYFLGAKRKSGRIRKNWIPLLAMMTSVYFPSAPTMTPASIWAES